MHSGDCSRANITGNKGLVVSRAYTKNSSRLIKKARDFSSIVRTLTISNNVLPWLVQLEDYNDYLSNDVTYYESSIEYQYCPGLLSVLHCFCAGLSSQNASGQCSYLL